MKERQVICEEPRIIINPSLPELIGKYKHYYFRGESFYNRSGLRNLFKFNFGRFSVRRNQIKHEDIDTCFVVDEETGQTYPIYLEVPCGKCGVCREAKVNAFVERCKLETQFYDCKPWFVTLTYDPEHVPHDGVQVRDVQLFFKRFRINLKRAGYDFKIRYVAVGEYGHKTHRPHYHLILWNIRTFTATDALKVRDILYSSWQQGFTQSRIIDPSDDKSFYYTAKYLRKPSVEGDDMKEKNPFLCYHLESMVASVRHTLINI